MEDKLLLGLLFLDKKFKTPSDVEELRPHIELVLKLASQREEFTEEERYLLKKLIYKIDRFSEFLDQQYRMWVDKLKIEGRA